VYTFIIADVLKRARRPSESDPSSSRKRQKQVGNDTEELQTLCSALRGLEDVQRIKELVQKFISQAKRD
jgi:hypothetical protein